MKSTVLGMDCPVYKPEVDAVRDPTAADAALSMVGVAIGRVQVAGKRHFQLLVRADDGTMLAALLDIDRFDRFTDLLAAEVEAENQEMILDRQDGLL